MKQRVFITGIGVITPVGNGKKEFWNSLIEGKSGIVDCPLIEDEVPFSKAGYINDFVAQDLLKGYNFRRMARNTRFAIAAIELAISDSNVDLETIEENRKGLIFNTIVGSAELAENFIQKLFLKGPEFVSPLKFAQTVTNAPATPVSIKHKLKGVSTVLQGASAVSMAYDFLSANKADLIICGGVDAITSADVFQSTYEAGILAHKENNKEEQSCPGDVNRNGFVLSEYSGFMILETEESVKKRNADIYCEILGYSKVHDKTSAYDNNKLSVEPLSYAIKNAIESANLTPDRINYCNSLANSCHSFDEIEAKAMNNVFGENSDVLVSTFKGSIGEARGASDAMGVIQSALSIKENKIAPIANLKEIDPDCRLNYVKENAVEQEINYAISNSAELGGNVQTVVLKKAEVNFE